MMQPVESSSIEAVGHDPDRKLLTKLRAAHSARKLAEATIIRDPLDGMICRLWRGKWDTADIARLAGHPESEVANRLAVLREGGAI